jgi:alcohol dehydrogenase (cytochrome c)
MIWSYGIFNYHAVDTRDNTLYITSTNRGLNYFTDEGSAGHRISPPHTMEQGLQNGTIVAMDLRTGKTIWQYKTEFPPRISPLITNDIVFTGYIPFSEQMNAKSTHMTTTKSGVVLALNKETGKKLWEFNVDAPISPVGLSIGGGMLFVPTGKIQTQPKHEPSIGGSIVAFGLN